MSLPHFRGRKQRGLLASPQQGGALPEIRQEEQTPGQESREEPPLSARRSIGGYADSLKRIPQTQEELLELAPSLRPPVGNVSASWKEWKKLGASDWLLEGIRYGFRMCPLGEEWRPRGGRNMIQDKEQEAYMDKHINEMQLSGTLIEVGFMPKGVYGMRLIPKKSDSKKMRNVINMRGLNIGLPYNKMKLESLQSVLPMIRPGDYLVTVDIKDAYHHFLVNPEDWSFLGIQWRNRHFLFRVLPFGASTSPYYFSKAMKVPIGALRREGVRVSNFFDDIITANQSLEGALRDRSRLLQVLSDLGMVRAENKGFFEPVKRVVYLGLEIDTRSCRVFITKDKILQIRATAQLLLRKKLAIPRKVIHKFCGKIASVIAAFAPARLISRSLYNSMGMLELKNPSKWWWEKVPLTKEAIEDLSWALEEGLAAWNGRSFQSEELLQQIVIDTDSSSNGFGAALESLVIQGLWGREEMPNHIGWKELKTVLIAVKEFIPHLKGKQVTVRTDNRIVLSYLTKAGGRIPQLNEIAREIFKICFQNNINLLKPYWLPSEDNQLADALSRGLQLSEWSLDDQVFRSIEEKWGKLTYDRFATDWNTKCPKFDAPSKAKGRKATAIDCFTQDWAGEKNYALCPFNLIPKVLKHVEACKAFTVVVLPAWKSAIWWPHLCSLTKETLDLPSPQTCFGEGEPLKNPHWRFIAAKIEF
jgi:hypothetical protein